MESFLGAFGFTNSFLDGICGFCCICLLEREYCSWYILLLFSLFVFGEVLLIFSSILVIVYIFLPLPQLKIVTCPKFSGAKDAHAVSTHFAQFLYYGVVSSLFTFPAHFSFGQAATLFQPLLKNRPLGFFQWFMALAFAFFSVKFFRLSYERNWRMIISKMSFSLINPRDLAKFQCICLIQSAASPSYNVILHSNKKV